MVVVCKRLSGCCSGLSWHVDGWPWSWWSWALVVSCGRCFAVVVAFVAIGVRGRSFVAVGDRCGRLSPFVVVVVAGRCPSCVLLVVVRERKATSRIITKQRLFVMRHK